MKLGPPPEDLEYFIAVEAKVNASITKEVKRFFISSLQEAYHIVAQGHLEDDGFNNNTFGFSIYHVGKHQLRKRMSELVDVVSLVSDKPRFRLSVGEYEVGCYKVGNNVSNNIWTSFPSSDGATKKVELTSFLPGFEHPDLLASKHIILAHMGNPDDLLSSAYLCIPMSLGVDDRISEWAYVQQIFDAESDELYLYADPQPALPRPAAEDVPEATVSKKIRKSERMTDDDV